MQKAFASVIKRDGREVQYDVSKIKNAITKANLEVANGDSMSDKEIDGIVASIERYIDTLGHTPTVEEIQDIVEEHLMAFAPKVSKKYIVYRYEHSKERDRHIRLMNTIKEKIFATNVENQNANVDERSFGGRKGEAANAVLKEYALNNLMSEIARKNHEDNIIYIHDLDSYALGQHNCLTLPLDDLLANGFNTRQTDVRPAQSVSTAFQLVAVLFQLQSLQQFGGVSASHLDWTMVPYVRKSFFKHWRDGRKYLIHDVNAENLVFFPDKSIEDVYYRDNTAVYDYAIDMTVKEVYQAVEGMYHNLNTLQSRSGNQLPFTSINYGTCTLPEGRLITKAILDISIKGIGKLHRTSVFPCGIFQSMKGVNRKEGDPNYDLFRLALKSTSKRLYPNYANVNWSGNEGYDINDPKTYFSTMGKRKLQPI